MGRRTFVDVIIFVLVAILGAYALFNQQDIRDWWILRSYQPPAEISALATTTAMSESGKRAFYASQPVLNDRDNFNKNCPFPDRSLVLGCFANNHIYIFKVDSVKLEGVEEVTAAHEMLHAAYARLGRQEREKVDKLTADALVGLRNERLNQTIDGYRQDDPDSVPNELHSLLGTEIRNLPAELEAHYAKYFTDRSRVVAIAESYEQVFIGLQAQIAGLANSISELRTRIDQTESKLTQDKSALDAEAARLNQLRQAGEFDQYNAGVPAYNSQVNTYNALVETYKDLVEQHNQQVAQHNELALEQNQLIQNLNSKFEPLAN